MIVRPFDRNFWLNVADGAFVTAGMALCSLQVVLPSWLTQLGATPTVIGLLPVVWFTGFALPQVLSAERIKPLAYRQPFLLKWGLFLRMAWLLLATAVWVFREHHGALMGATFLAVIVCVTGIGMVNPVWLQFIGKITPSEHRGRLHGLRMFFGGPLSLAGAWAAGEILNRSKFPVNYAWVFGGAFILLMCSWACFALVRERTPSVTQASRPSREAFSGALRIFREDGRFGELCVTGGLVHMAAWMPSAFLVTYGLQEGLLASSQVGTMAVVLAGANMGWSIGGGWFGDRFGARALVTVICLCALASVGAALLASGHPAWLPWAIACSGGAVTGCMIAFPNLILECSPSGAEAAYTAVASQVFAAGAAAGPLAAGIMAERFGFPAMFWMVGGLGGWALWRTRRLMAAA